MSVVEVDLDVHGSLSEEAPLNVLITRINRFCEYTDNLQAALGIEKTRTLRACKVVCLIALCACYNSSFAFTLVSIAEIPLWWIFS